MKRILGFVLMSLPMIGILSLSWYSVGFLSTLTVLVISVIVVLCIVVGCNLTNE